MARELTAHKRPSFRPALEPLEDRMVPAAPLEGRILEIEGSMWNDQVFVDDSGPNGEIKLNMNGVVQHFPFRDESGVPIRLIRFHGGDGHDKLSVTGPGSVSVEAHGGTGNDTLSGGLGPDRLFGDADDDTLNGGECLGGADSDDFLDGGENNDILNGASGNDTLLGGNGIDQLIGGDDHDRLEGGADNDFLFGTDGNDSLFGGGGVDQLHGGNHNDFLDGGRDGLSDVLFGNSGEDTFVSEFVGPWFWRTNLDAPMDYVYWFEWDRVI